MAVASLTITTLSVTFSPSNAMQCISSSNAAPEGSEILHGPIGAYLISKLCGVKDEALLDAIREHTIGGLQMSLLSKCLFVADAIEDGRDYPGVDVAREIATKNIDDAVFYLLKHTLEFLLEKEVSIFPKTIEVYNHYLKQRKGE